MKTTLMTNENRIYVTSTTQAQLSSILLDLAVIELVKGNKVHFHTVHGMDNLSEFDANYQKLQKLSGDPITVSIGGEIPYNSIEEGTVLFVDKCGDELPIIHAISARRFYFGSVSAE